MIHADGGDAEIVRRDAHLLLPPVLDKRLGLGCVGQNGNAREIREGTSEELIRPGDRLLGFQVAVGPDTVDLSDRSFVASPSEITG